MNVVEMLIKLLKPYKAKYTKDEMLKAITSEGYSNDIAKKVVVQIYVEEKPKQDEIKTKENKKEIKKQENTKNKAKTEIKSETKKDNLIEIKQKINHFPVIFI